MENNPSENTTTEVQVPYTETDEKTELEVETLLKKTLISIGRHSIMAYEIENEQIQLDAIRGNDSASNPIIANRYRVQQEELNKRNEGLLEEQAISLKCITDVAELYRKLFVTKLQKVKMSIEEAMIEYGNVLSKDTVDRINNESAILKVKIDEQKDQFSTFITSMQTKTQQIDTKMEGINGAMVTHAQDAAKLFAANNKCAQATTTLDQKLTTMQQKLDEMATYFEKKIASSTSQTESQRTAVEAISAVISSKISQDKEDYVRQINQLKEEQVVDKTRLEALQSEFKAIQQQVESLSSQKNNNEATETFVTPPTSSPSSSSTASTSTPLSDKELINIKTTLSGLQLKSKELFQLLSALVKSGGEPIGTIAALESLKANMSLQRLDDVEKNVVYLLSKVEVMEPRYRLDFAEIKQLLEAKGVSNNSHQQPIPSLGDKRSHHTMNNDNDHGDEDKIQQLEEEVKRVDFKLASLVEYIHQFRSNVLNPSFPDKLDSGLQHMEEILRNHEMFIAYLVDPVAVSANELNDEESSMTMTVARQPDLRSTMSPALLTTITKLVADKTKKEYEIQDAKKRRKMEQSASASDTAIPENMEKYMAKLMADQVEPLKKKISELEQQLQQQQKNT